MFKIKKCKHTNVQTITNIYGDAINHLNGRRIVNCIDCGKEIILNDLDKYCKRSNIFNLRTFNLKAEELGEVSDGSHTFNELYYHRMVLFSIICNTYKDKAWKSWLHDDGTMYDDYFIVGITTPVGDYSYHYEKSHWDRFDVKELEKAPKWDGHKPEDIIRLYSLL